MDPIMKLLEDDEDESLHSGADVEAFTAALNREVEASTSVPAGSSSQTTDHGARFLPQEHKSLLNHGHGQWQDPVKNKIVNQETQQQEQTHALTNDHPSRPEMVSQGSNNNPFPTNTPKERYLLKAKQDPGTTSQQGIVAQQQPMQRMKCEQTPIVTQQQSMHQMKSQQTPGTNQTNSATTTAKAPVVPFHMLFPILRPYLDKGRDMQVQSIFAKLRKRGHEEPVAPTWRSTWSCTEKVKNRYCKMRTATTSSMRSRCRLPVNFVGGGSRRHMVYRI